MVWDGDLLNALDVRLDADGADDAFVIVDAVDDPVVEAFVLAIDREAGRVGAAIVRTSAAAEAVTLAFVGSGDERDELDEVATIEGKVLDSLRGHGRADGGAVGPGGAGLRR